ncbi:MAG: hypothetical protein HRT69_09865 [Flavobacteriaceae bacterium]|nr:hypothetical protein [Flavobacteriaceae bacterium]
MTSKPKVESKLVNKSVEKKRFSLRLSIDLYNKIEALAVKENRSVANYIETVLLEKII